MSTLVQQMARSAVECFNCKLIHVEAAKWPSLVVHRGPALPYEINFTAEENLEGISPRRLPPVAGVRDIDQLTPFTRRGLSCFRRLRLKSA